MRRIAGEKLAVAEDEALTARNMEHEEAELDDVGEDEDEDELVGLRADYDAASCPDAPRPRAPPRRAVVGTYGHRARAPLPPRHGARGGRAGRRG